MLKKIFVLLPLGLLLGGCAATSVSRLTSPHTFRSPDGYYLLEAQLDSTRQALVWDHTITATAYVPGKGGQAYPMHPTSMMTNRWETLVPIPAGQTSISYQFKFDYYCNSYGKPPQIETTWSKVFSTAILNGQ